MKGSGTRATVVTSCVAVLSLGVGIGMVALADHHDSATPAAEKPGSTFTEAQVLGMWGADPGTAQEHRLPWVRLDANREYAGFDGCNSVAGTWALHTASNTVRVDEQITSLVGCPTLPQVSFEDMKFDGASLTYTVAGGATKTMRPVQRQDSLPELTRERDQLVQKVRDLTENQVQQVGSARAEQLPSEDRFNPYVFDYDRRNLIRGIDPPTKEWPD